MSQPVACSNCGAMMTPQWDGRTYACPFCKTKVQVAISGDQIAAGMSLDLTNIDAFLARLAFTLHQGFHEHTRIEAQGNWVIAIEIHLEPDVYMVRREGQHAVAHHKKIVRGIALRTKEMPLDQWVALLTDSLAAQANTNARAAWVLGQLGGKR
ncbi:MAG TPA: hypothetical protein VIF62_00915 [Labilithrix sp.]|jgi:hypothetical protein